MKELSALDKACERMRQQELERQRRKECERIKALLPPPPPPPRRPRSRDPDKRLNNWQNYLKLRQRLVQRIMKRTGKDPSQVLLNCSGSVEKAMIQRLFEQADRLSPENNWRWERLKETKTRCGLDYTLPDDRLLRRNFTIYGLPECVKRESQSLCCIPNWFKSKLITKRFLEKKIDIFGIITHYPDVENLQIIGTAVKFHEMPEIDEDLMRLSQMALRKSINSLTASKNSLK